MALAGLPPESHVSPPAGDGRPPLAEIYRATESARAAGWQTIDVASQPADADGSLPIRACFNAPDVDLVLLGGIHGREPAGAVALARCLPRLLRLSPAPRLLVMPLLNPWGYLHHARYGPSGRSVSDSDHALGRADAPACGEAGAIADFLLNGIRVRPGAAVLDLHEDAVYEAPEYAFEGLGSYLYFIGDDAADRPASCRVRECLRRSRLPLVGEGVTRFGERIVNGAIVDSADGSVDELLARRLMCTPVITAELVLRAPAVPPLADRVDVYLDVIDAFFGVSVR